MKWFKVTIERHCSYVESTIEQSSVYVQAPSSEEAAEQVRSRMEADEDLISDLDFDWEAVDGKLHASDVDWPEVVSATIEEHPTEDAFILRSQEEPADVTDD